MSTPDGTVEAQTELRRDVTVWGSYRWGFADVGADVFVALGLVFGAAQGATPLAFALAGLVYTIDTAKFIVNQHNLVAKTRIMPHRTAADGILRIAREESVDAIILGVDEHQHAIPGPMGRTVIDVMRKASCEVIVDKLPSMETR